MAFELADIRFFQDNAADIRQASQQLEGTRAKALAEAEFLRERFGEHGRAVGELADARRRALRTAKFADTWLSDVDAVQQATPAPVARARARHLAGMGVDFVHDVTCSVGTEAPAVQAAGIGYLGSDLDRPRVAMAQHNVPGVPFVVADAMAPVSARGVVVADPARRAGGQRITKPEQLLPTLPDLLAAYPGRPMAVKCAPGLDYSEWAGPVVVASVDGAVKEACLYTPDLQQRSAPDGQPVRAAWLLRGGDDSRDGGETISSTDFAADELPAAGEVGRYIVDPDGAVVRAGLVKHYAARHGLWQLDEKIAYLTGEAIPPGRSGFPFIEQVSLKRLSSCLKSLDAGSLEILVRGVNIDPDQLRKKLKLRGTRPLAVVVTRLGRGAVALVCEPRQWN